MSNTCLYDTGRVFGNFYGGSLGDINSFSSPFVQVLDESMCVIREDICDWLQRYVFNEAQVAPLDNPCDLLERLKSGVWLARLAHKLHFKVLAANLSRCTRGVKVTSREHKLYSSLRGTGPSNALGHLTADNLPVFSQPIKHAAESRLSESDIATGGFSYTPLGYRPTSASAAAENQVGVRLRNHWAARGNVSAFIEWCHSLGISQTVLFETTGLVNRTEEKNVLLTLMDLARLASRFGLAELPELVRMEREIEALEAAAADALSSPSAGTMTEDMVNVSTGAYASRMNDRKHNFISSSSSSVHSPCLTPTSLSSTPSEIGFYDLSTSSTNTEPATPYHLTNTVATTTTVFIDTSIDADEEAAGKGISVKGRRGSSTMVDRMSSNATSTNNGSAMSNLTENASCQVNSNNSVQTVSTGTSISATNTVTVFVDLDDSSETASNTASIASLPPLKASQATPKTKPRATKKTQSPRTEVTKRSTSVADLRELAKLQPKRRNTKEGRESAAPQRGRPMRAQDLPKSTVAAGKALAPSAQQPRSRSQVRTPVLDRDHVVRSSRSQLPHSTSSVPKPPSSGFASRSSSCSDLAAEVRKQTAHCTCCSRNRLMRLDEGRYQMGFRIYYLRRFRSHVMVRVGGGWLTLPQFLDRYDPCRQKEGDLLSLTSSNANVNGESGATIRVPASSIFKSWPSTESLKTNSR